MTPPVPTKFLTRDQAMRIDGRKIETVHFPELDGHLRIAELTSGPATALQAILAREGKGEADATKEKMMLVIENAIVDEKGDPLFDSKSAADFFDRLPQSALMRIMDSIPKDAATAEHIRKAKDLAQKAIADGSASIPEGAAVIPSKVPEATEKKA